MKKFVKCGRGSVLANLNFQRNTDMQQVARKFCPYYLGFKAFYSERGKSQEITFFLGGVGAIKSQHTWNASVSLMMS